MYNLQDMEYNTGRNQLVMREYGRHIQKMIEYLLSIEDKETRQRNAYAVIELMGFLNPHLKNVEDFRHKERAHGRLELVAVPDGRDLRIDRLRREDDALSRQHTPGATHRPDLLARRVLSKQEQDILAAHPSGAQQNEAAR